MTAPKPRTAEQGLGTDPAYERRVALDEARMEIMRVCLKAEARDARHGEHLSGDSALAVLLSGFQEHLSTRRQRHARWESAC